MRRRLEVACIALFAATSVSDPARAEWTATADVQLVIPVGEPETNPGWLASVRFGRRFPIGALTLGPEIGGGYGVYTPVASARKAVGDFYGGVRLGLDFVPVVTPYAFGRLGYGVASTTNLPDPNEVQTFSSGAFIDLGLGAGHRLGSAFELGLEGGYTTIEPGHCFCARWAHAGVTGTFLF